MLGQSVKRLLPCLAGIEPACLLSGYEGFLWAKGLQIMARGPGLPPCLLYFSTGTQFPYSLGCFFAATTEMSSCNRDIRVHRAKTVYKLVLGRKSLLTLFWGAAKLPLELLDKHEEEAQSQASQSISCGQRSDRCCGNVHSPAVLSSNYICEWESAQSYLTFCNPMDYTAPGILQARILEWVAFPVSRESSQHRHPTQVSHIAGGFFQLSHRGDQEYWSE